MKILIAFIIVTFFSTSPSNLNSIIDEDADYMNLSIEMLEKLKTGESVEDIVVAFEKSSLEDVAAQINTDDIKISFWINVYNAYILYILNENPELYEDRRSFFKQPFVKIAGKTLSFADIEHGIIRRSQHEYFLGYLSKWFPPKYQKVLRPDEREYRVHFALNCGAKSCPPITILEPEKLEAQLAQMTKSYLNKVTKFNKESNEVTTTPLFSWFRGDFKGKRGVKRILLDQKLIPKKKVKLKFGSYDWTLALNNFAFE